MRHETAVQLAANGVEGHPVPTEVYLIIFLLVATLVFSYFYSERAQTRRSASRQEKDDVSQTDTIEA
jgi:hypothetical protein